MQYHIDTIPIWEAYKADVECPLCAVKSKIEQDFVQNALGGSVMEVDVRMAVNEQGFCSDHFAKLFTGGNVLGLALMTHSHLNETIKDLQKNMHALSHVIKKQGVGLMDSGVLSKVNQKSPISQNLAKLAHQTKNPGSTCHICQKIDANMHRYIYTILYMFEHEPTFAKALENSKGFCLPHFSQVMTAAPKHLHGKHLKSFLHCVLNIQEQNLLRLEKELKWFTEKFDYRNADAPWGSSRDALQRTINKLRSTTFGEENAKA